MILSERRQQLEYCIQQHWWGTITNNLAWVQRNHRIFEFLKDLCIKGSNFPQIAQFSGENNKKYHLNQYYQIFLGNYTNSNASSNCNAELYQVWNTACEAIIGQIIIVHILEPFRHSNDSFYMTHREIFRQSVDNTISHHCLRKGSGQQSQKWNIGENF